MVWTGYSSDYDDLSLVIYWGLAIDGREAWTVDPDGDETKSQIVSISPIVLALDGQTADVQVTFENTTSINSNRWSDELWVAGGGLVKEMVGMEAAIYARGEAGTDDTIFSGIVTQVDRIDEMRMQITISDNTAKALESPIGDLFETSDYTNIPDDAVGRCKPIIFGSLTEFVPVLVDELPSTKLNGDIEYSTTTITVEDTTGFSSSGTIVIEDEEIDYSSTTSTTFVVSGGYTGRGQNGTQPVPHPSGAGVYETSSNGVQYYVAEHAATVGDVYGYDAQTDTFRLIDSGDYTKDETGPTLIKFDLMPRYVLKRTSPAGSQQIGVGALTGLAQENATVTSPVNMYDVDTSTYSTLTNPAGGTPRASATVTFPSISGLDAHMTIRSIRAYCRYGAAGDDSGFVLQVTMDPSGGDEETIELEFPPLTSADTVVRGLRTSAGHLVSDARSNLPDFRIKTDRDDANATVRVYDIRVEFVAFEEEDVIEYEERPYRTLAIDVTGLRNANGNAGNIIDDLLTSTDFTSAGLSNADLNSTSITQLGTDLSTLKYCGAVMERRPAREIIEAVLSDMAAGYYWDRARKLKVYAKYLGTEPAASRTLDGDDVLSAPLQLARRASIDTVLNSVDIKYNWSHARQAFRNTYNGTYPYSINAFGTRKVERGAMWITAAGYERLKSSITSLYGFDQHIVEFETPLVHIDLERYDMISIANVGALYDDLTDDELSQLRILEISIDPMRNVIRLKALVRSY